MPKLALAMVGLGVVSAFIGSILFISALFSFLRVRSFSKCSESITGRVGKKYVHHGNNRRYYSMDITYTVDAIEYKRSVPASLSEYNTLQAGDPFEIQVRSDKPNKIIRADSLSEQSAKKVRKLLVTSGVMTVLGVALILIRVFTV